MHRLLAADSVPIGVQAEDILSDDPDTTGVVRTVSATTNAVVVSGVHLQAVALVRRMALALGLSASGTRTKCHEKAHSYGSEQDSRLHGDAVGPKRHVSLPGGVDRA